MNKPIDIDAYITGFPEEVQKILQQLRAAVHAAAPNAEEFISYGMPGFHWGGKVKIWFAAYKKHIGMYPVYGLSILQDELEPYRGKNTKDSLHFPLDKPLPLELIGKIVKMKVEQAIPAPTMLRQPSDKMDKTKIAVDIFDKRAGDYQDKFMDLDLYHDTFDLFCDSIAKENADILELACGPGNITRYLLKKRPGFKILGIDLAPNMIALAKNNNPEAEFRLMDCRDIGTIGQKYDAIMCGFCLPYLSKEESVELIGHTSKLLNPQGILYISTMEDSYDKSGLESSSKGDQVYIHYHESGYLTDALLANGFKIIHIERKKFPFPKQDGTTITDLVIIAGK